jgi:16S rRNA (guanine966-N2)-methyltransferase
MDKVRAAVFSALGDAVKGVKVLDLFAGSGSYGFEALSRGAQSVTFVDSSKEAIKAIQNNSKSLKTENVSIFNEDVLSFLSKNPQEFSLIFADPPYKLEIYEELVDKLVSNSFLSKNAIIVLESEKELNINQGYFSSARFYKYGLAKVYILRK